MTVSTIVSFVEVTFTIDSSISGGTSFSVPGVKVGDVFISLYNTGDYINALAHPYFRPVVTTDDELYRIQAPDGTYAGVLLRK